MLVAIILRQPASPERDGWLVENASERLISTYGWGEFIDTIARDVRRGSLTVAAADAIVDHFGRRSERWIRHETTDADVLDGAALITADMTRGLKLGDAIHLAICRRLGSTLLTGDRRQAAAATAFDIPAHFILPNPES